MATCKTLFALWGNKGTGGRAVRFGSWFRAAVEDGDLDQGPVVWELHQPIEQLGSRGYFPDGGYSHLTADRPTDPDIEIHEHVITPSSARELSSSARSPVPSPSTVW